MNKRQMLVIEGKSHLVQQMQEACAGTEFEVLPCWDEPTATLLLQTGRIDLICAEAFMPSGLVLNVILKIRAMPEHSSTPLMIVAAEPGGKAKTLLATTSAAAELMGADKFITMHEFDPKWMLAEMRALLLSRNSGN